MGSPPLAWRDAGPKSIRVSDGSERHLGAQRDSLDSRARRRRATERRGRTTHSHSRASRRHDLVYVSVDIVEHEADIGDGIPVDAEDVSRLASAEDATAGERP